MHLLRVHELLVNSYSEADTWLPTAVPSDMGLVDDNEDHASYLKARNTAYVKCLIKARLRSLGLLDWLSDTLDSRGPRTWPLLTWQLLGHAWL